MSDVKNAVTGTTSTVLPSGEKVGRLKDTAERNPLGLAIGGVAVGFVAGLLLPSTRIENESMGEMSDRVVDAVKETAGEAIESGKQVAHETVDSATQQAQDLASTLQDGPGDGHQRALGQDPRPIGPCNRVSGRPRAPTPESRPVPVFGRGHRGTAHRFNG